MVPAHFKLVVRRPRDPFKKFFVEWPLLWGYYAHWPLPLHKKRALRRLQKEYLELPPLLPDRQLSSSEDRMLGWELLL